MRSMFRGGRSRSSRAHPREASWSRSTALPPMPSSDWRRAAPKHRIRFPAQRARSRRAEDMATILLVGTDVPLLEGLAQTLAAVGHSTHLAGTLSEAMEVAAAEIPLVAVVERSLIQPAGDPLRIPLARGGALVVYRPDSA